MSITTAILAVFLALAVDQAPAAAQTAPAQSPAQLQSPAEPGPAGPPGQTPATDEAGGTEPDASPPPDGGDDAGEADPTPDGSPSTEEVGPTSDDGAGIQPSVRRSAIPGATVALAVGVLIAVALGAFLTGRKVRSPGASSEVVDPARAPPAPSPVPTPIPATPDRDRAYDPVLIAFLIELGEALVNAGESVNQVATNLRAVAAAHGVDDMGVVVLPTALMLSVPGAHSVETNVVGTEAGQLRLDQVEEVLRLVDTAALGHVGVARGRARLAAIMSSEPPVPVPLALAGHALAAVGLALVLRGGPVEVVLAGVLGAVAGLLRVGLPTRDDANRQPFMPLVASFVIATCVLLVARIAPDMAILPPVVAPLITFLPGALLTMGTLELATGQALSGVARLGLGGIKLVLLAGGILGAVQLLGVPGADVTATPTAPGWSGAVGAIAPWLGVALFGLGIAAANSARRTARPWILLVLFVAYAGQVLGGLFFGTVLSAFFGALAMTPVAVYVGRLKLGPPTLVTFLPAFWLLVPGALGLEGITRILNEQGVQGVTTLVTTGAAMVAIALGILLGLLVADPRTWRVGTRPR
ncbi:MAG TPA: threonine/serine exporter family protein [Nitriliruptoraceae bacterium]|nr:threonine/serine exporter family protein [Nitriliruptoraceae bacterium]